MLELSRRDFLKAAGLGAAAAVLPRALRAGAADRPNIILLMSDDQGWGDVGYNGHPVLRTPHLDAFSRSGLRFDRWYSGAPVCSPTRAMCITGRHPYRYGIRGANDGSMPPEEVTLAEAVRAQGYATGHFGKWHLGTLTTEIRDANRGGPGSEAVYSPPWENGFDVCFSTESRVPTWDPTVTPDPVSGPLRGEVPGQPFHTYYWTGPGRRETENLEGDSSRILMDRAIPFIEEAVRARQPFFAVIWLHAPHEPVVAGPAYRALYAEQSEDEQHYYGVITAMDEQIGRLRRSLRALGAADNTMLWFSSDNGPASPSVSPRCKGRTGPFRGRKGSLYEGGVRVPGLLEWPARIRQPRAVGLPCCTVDYFPTVLDVLGFRVPGQPTPLDGVSLLPLIEGRMSARPRPIAFQQGRQVSLSDNRYKLISEGREEAPAYGLFDLIDDPSETRDLAAVKPEVRRGMQATLEAWLASCSESRAGKDYPNTNPGRSER